jgi:histone H2A
MSEEIGSRSSAAGARKTKKPGVSSSVRAGLKFPVGRVLRYLRKGRYASRIGKGAAVYMAAALEYMTAELIELSGNSARDNGYKGIRARDITLAIKNDEELNQMYGTAIIANGGVNPHIHAVLLPKKKKKKADAEQEEEDGDGEEEAGKKKKKTKAAVRVSGGSAATGGKRAVITKAKPKAKPKPTSEPEPAAEASRAPSPAAAAGTAAA